MLQRTRSEGLAFLPPAPHFFFRCTPDGRNSHNSAMSALGALCHTRRLTRLGTSKLAERKCLNCPRSFTPSTVHQLYCRPVCAQSARRRRDREARRWDAPSRRLSPEPANPGQVRRIAGECLRCRRHRWLRFDTYGLATDPMLDCEPLFCSQSCAVAWWRAEVAAGADASHVSTGLYVLIYGRIKAEEDPPADPDEDDYRFDDDDDDI